MSCQSFSQLHTAISEADLTSTELDVTGVQYLAEGHWPLLDTLILTWNDLDEEHVALLANADWPLLHTLRVSYDYVEISAFAILSICQHDVMCFIHGVCSCCPVMHKRLPVVHLLCVLPCNCLLLNLAAFALGVLGVPPCNATFLC